MKKNTKSLLVLILIIVAVIVGVSIISNALSNDEELEYGEVVWYLENDLVKWDKNQYIRYTVTLSPNKISFTAKVEPWKEYDVNLDENKAEITPKPETPETGGDDENEKENEKENEAGE